MGRVTLFNEPDDKVFSFISACCEAAEAVKSVPTADASDFAAQICPLIQQRLAAVKESGKLGRYPSPEPIQSVELGRTIVRIRFDGYFNGQPFRAGIRFYHLDQELRWGTISHDLNRWHKTILLGSMRVASVLLETEDPRLEKYRTDACRFIANRFKHPDTAIGLQDAIEAARNFIGACSDPIAKDIEELAYQRIGGEIQIATVTPKNGFQWESRPEQFDPV